jgi:RNA polymerase sigma-70 factor, ECF subfamily
MTLATPWFMRKTTLPGFDRLVELHYPSLFHFAVGLSRSPLKAINLTQRTFHKALDRARELPVPKNTRAWLFTILFHEFLEGRTRTHRS